MAGAKLQPDQAQHEGEIVKQKQSHTSKETGLKGLEDESSRELIQAARKEAERREETERKTFVKAL